MSDPIASAEVVKSAALRLLGYCRARNWAGYDPYDALNSELFKALPFLNFRFFRLALTQGLKRLPFNLRPLLLIPKTQNPKGLALFLMASLNMSKCGVLDNGESLEMELTEDLLSLRSPQCRYWCWGYSFPWQTRALLVPRGEANLVCTSFVANALLDMYDHRREPRYLDIATSAAEYILDTLYWTEGDSTSGFSYPIPSSRARVHNANFLGAALLCRIYSYSGEKKFLGPALKVARHSASLQERNGSWDYGELATQRWKDNFHTGYNLCALRAICQYVGTTEFEAHIRRGFEFYRSNFFREDGAPKYFHDRTNPLDVHCVAQSIITLVALRDLHDESIPMAVSTFEWAMTHMRDEVGYFYYRKLPIGANKIPYMRWSQAWMLLALSTLLAHFGHAPSGVVAVDS
jgi:hypothetical protein